MDFVLAARMLGAFAVIATVLIALQFLARANLRQRLTGRGDRRLVDVLETTMLPNSAALHVVRIGEKYVVVGRSGGHIATLDEIPQATIDAWLSSQATSGLSVSPAGIIARLRRDRSGSDT